MKLNIGFSLQSVKSVKVLFLLGVSSLFLVFFNQFYSTVKFDIFCREMLHNGTSQGVTLDSWHTTGCSIHKYTLK